jgi:N-methylhydantoinase A/oxoprolinase/acetone carboxylase beta subunit
LRRLGVDVGGTFTDIVLAAETGGMHVLKVESTPEDPSRAMIGGLVQMLDEVGGDGTVSQVLHGTTIATNMILEHHGCAVGMLTTEGFRDLLHIARHKRPFNFSLYQELPWQSAPVVQRRHRLPVPERIGASGEVVLPLDEEAVRAQARRLKQAGVEAVAVCFLFSFLNPDHEDRAAEIVREEHPGAFVSVSGRVVPQYREFERFATACLNAYVGPDVRRYLQRLVAGIPDEITSEVHVMTSSGGVTTVTDAIERPVQLVLSGPVAGVVGGMWSGSQVGEDNVITLDVGGTSADIGLVEGGTLRMRPLSDSGVGAYQALIPMVDVSTIGAGGGSVAFVDDGGMFRVGPRSAGARPGPAAYGFGGTEATITDAMVNVGWFGHDIQLAGRPSLSPELAHAAFEPIAARLGLSVIEASAGAIEIMASAMMGAIEESSTRKGYDPRDFSLIAGGGAGPSIAPLIAREVGMPRVIVPAHPGLMSTIGLLATDVAYEMGRSIHATASTGSLAALAEGYHGLEAAGAQMLRRAGIAEQDMAFQRLADCRYVGQGYELRVACPGGPIDQSWLASLTVNFEKVHTREYSMHYDDRGIEIPTIHLRAIGRMPKIEAAALRHREAGLAPFRTEPAWFMTASGPREFETSRCQRDQLAIGVRYEGPMVVAQYDSTLVVPPQFTLEVGAAGNLIVVPCTPGTERA